MKFIRILIAIVFIAVVGAWSVNVVLSKTVRDHTPPVITSDRDVLELSVKDDKSKLLTGLTATDDRDGDLTSEILVGTHSRFISEGVCDITYLVFDSNKNVGKFTRRTKYTDYTEPVFSLKEPLMFKSGDTVSMFTKISLTDCLDGDISSKVKIVVNDVDNSKLGTYYVTFEASNSYADVVNRKLPVNIVNDTVDSPQIALTDYLIYVNVGDTVQPQKYIKSVTDKYDSNIGSDKVEINSTVDTRAPGVHQVAYSYTDSRGLTGHSFLIVIVREG
ncbi:MAG TPA: hypothetical protein DCY31_05705 [Ruminococcaceae bacterium]|nr:hypothetical protein [Oscillospiraceae bacterium]HAY73330.1 hypothetical protein [Oscillospiraceae bacterium]